MGQSPGYPALTTVNANLGSARDGQTVRIRFRIGCDAGVGVNGWDIASLSFTNLTSVGLSDISPVLPNARSVVMVEQVAGLMYVALVISRVVATTVARQRTDAGRE